MRFVLTVVMYFWKITKKNLFTKYRRKLWGQSKEEVFLIYMFVFTSSKHLKLTVFVSMMHVNIVRSKCLYFIPVDFCHQQLHLTNLKEVLMFSKLCFKCNSVFTTLYCVNMWCSFFWKRMGKWLIFLNWHNWTDHFIWSFKHQKL